MLPSAVHLMPTPSASRYGRQQSNSPGAAVRPSLEYVPDWGVYGPAIARWEHLTRPAPAPVDARGRLDPAFVEWAMGWPPGHVTGHGLSRADALRLCGNGVVPQQAARALHTINRLVKEHP